MPNKRIGILGGGIAGITTAYILLKKCPYIEVTIISKEFCEKTTSWVAGGLNADAPIRNERSRTWVMKTKAFLEDLLKSGEAPTWGVYTALGYKVIFNEDDDLDQILEYDIAKELSKEEIQKVFPNLDINEFKKAYLINALFCNPMVFLPHIYKQVEQMGGKFIKKDVKKISEVKGFDCFVNCTGFGAKELFNDGKLLAVRGQVVQMKAPFFHYWYHIGHSIYAYPDPNGVVKLGGSFQKGNTSKEIDENLKFKIVETATNLVPSFRKAEFLEDLVGFRPLRAGGPRVEIEEIIVENMPLRVIHNYGYGQTGYSFFWGCSEEAAHLVIEELFTQVSKY